jgi:hypothetical protein
VFKDCDMTSALPRLHGAHESCSTATKNYGVESHNQDTLSHPSGDKYPFPACCRILSCLCPLNSTI